MNTLKKLKLLVASALLSSTGVYANDCSDTTATNCGITISGNQTIDIDSSISTTNERGIFISNGSNTLTIDGDITVNSNINAAEGIKINSSPASNNVINMLITLLLAGLLLILIPSAALMLLLTVMSPSMVSVFDPLEIKIPRSFVVLIEESISMV